MVDALEHGLDVPGGVGGDDACAHPHLRQVGVPGNGDAAKVVVLAGETHALSGGAALITEEVDGWLRGLLGGGGLLGPGRLWLPQR